MSGEDWRIEGTHVPAGDGDEAAVKRQRQKLLEPLDTLIAECFRVRDQHRAQLDASAVAARLKEIAELAEKGRHARGGPAQRRLFEKIAALALVETP